MRSPVALKEPAAIRAKAEFEVTHGRTSNRPWRISFKTFYELHRKGLPQREIARRIGVTTFVVRMAYGLFLKELFHDKTYRTYREELFATCLPNRPPTHYPLKRVAEEAKKHGILVESETYYRKGVKIQPHRKTLMLNGYRCAVHFMRTARRRRGNRAFYAVAAVTRELKGEVDAGIFLAEVPGHAPRLLIIRSSVIRERLGAGAGRLRTLYIPLGTHTPTGRQPVMEMEEYQDNWSVLTPPLQAAA